jgi:hypothetical protein
MDVFDSESMHKMVAVFIPVDSLTYGSFAVVSGALCVSFENV